MSTLRTDSKLPEKTLACPRLVRHSSRVATDRRPTAIVFAVVILPALLLLGCPTPVGPAAGDGAGPADGTPVQPYDPATQTLVPANDAHELPVVVSSTTKGILTTDGSRLAAIFFDKTPATEYALLSAGGDTWSAHAVPDFTPITSVDLYSGTVYLGGPSSTIAYGPVGGSDYEKRPLRVKPTDGKVGTAIHSVLPGMGEVLVATAEGLYCLPDDGGAKDAELIHGDEQTTAYYEIDARRLATGASGIYVAAPPNCDDVDHGVVTIDRVDQSWESSRSTDGLPGDDVYDVVLSGSRLFAATGAGLAFSDDVAGGFTVIDLDRDDQTVEPVAHDLFVHNGVVYAGTSNGLWYSADAGTSWTRFDVASALPGGATSATVRSIAVVGNRVYLAVDAYGILELRWQ
jgi:hypothetical protein